EAAHQLGTPISSLMGWLEYLRYQEKTSPGESAEKTYEEIEEDIARLRRVAARFSDIGSLPKLDPQPIAPVIENTASYIERRLPQQGMLIKLNVDVDPDYTVPLNAELFEWVIENLLKNALDALGSDQGSITLDASSSEGIIQIDISDTGKGIDRRDWKNVFRPGFSTKKRGWGLGLSLAKRIVEDYHGGSLSLVSSRPGQGTTFRIELPESAS
ncbi:MAG: HAMP domain-containing histidine kinase, partial [Bacteroidetes Order II. Incertae sedis bacterium]|nr:HAMP domain-containing histidine kinase [Bacteroidetes Order II. bacterium]